MQLDITKRKISETIIENNSNNNDKIKENNDKEL